MRPVPVGAAGAGPGRNSGPPACWWVYIRRYSPRTRPWIYFHCTTPLEPGPGSFASVSAAHAFGPRIDR